MLLVIKHFSSRNFKSEVLENDNIVLVDFFATWCGPCQMLSPIIDELSEDSELSLKLDIGKLDIDESSDIAQSYNVMSVPTLILLKNGKEIHRITGFVPKEQLKESLMNIISEQNL